MGRQFVIEPSYNNLTFAFAIYIKEQNMIKRKIISLFAILAFTSVPAWGQANPCNPCDPCNPCVGKMTAPKLVSVNPCHAKFGTVFFVADPMRRDQVTFLSEAPLEDIVGTTSEISGYFAFNPDRPKDGIRGFFTVPVKSLNTGIPLRNEHLQSEMWLNAASNPDITFTIESVENVYLTKRAAGSMTYTMQLVGPFTVNGNTNQLRVPARITYLQESKKTRMKKPGNLLGVRAEFELALADFGITDPSGSDLIGVKVGETVTIEVKAFASDMKPTAGNPCNPCDPCNPCGGKAKNPCNPCNPCGGKAKNPCNPCGP